MSLLEKFDTLVDNVLAYASPVKDIFKDNAPSQLNNLISKVSQYNKYLFSAVNLYGVAKTLSAVYPNLSVSTIEKKDDKNTRVFLSVSEIGKQLLTPKLRDGLRPAFLTLSALYVTYRNW